MNHHLKNHIKKITREKPEILAVFLYGSRADGSATPLSDMDVAILLTKEPSSEIDRLDLELEIEAKLSQSINELQFDVRIINNAPILVAGKILTEGKCLYCADDQKLADVRERVLLPYLDFKIDYDPLIEEIFTNQLNDR
ncbi:MAG: nucleotidyltransferase domain-containing protein [Bacteroidales bacterium]|nr:nucleotidyltransferase domain-containing protein [Bacteroidales bacterium]